MSVLQSVALHQDMDIDPIRRFNNGVGVTLEVGIHRFSPDVGVR